MPAERKEQSRKLPSGKWQLRYYNSEGVRHSGGVFPSRSAARGHYRNVIEPQLSGRNVARADVTLAEHVDRYLAAHATGRDASTIKTLTHRLGYATSEFGDLTLEQLERRVPEIAAWIGTLPRGSRYGIVQALRQALEAAVRWGHMANNPAKLAGPNPQPKAEEIRPFTQAELDLVAEELGPKHGPMVVFASETGMRPSEWLAVEWRDIDRTAGVVLVERTCAYGVTKSYGKTARSRRRVPLSTRALDALEVTPRRLDVRLVFPGHRGGVIDLKHFRRAHWKPALDTAGIPPRRIYDMRHSFATWALDAGLSIFDLSRYMGTSVEMIDRTYGHLAQGAEESARTKLDAAYARRTADVRASPSAD
jgi:integrase